MYDECGLRFASASLVRYMDDTGTYPVTSSEGSEAEEGGFDDDNDDDNDNYSSSSSSSGDTSTCTPSTDPSSGILSPSSFVGLPLSPSAASSTTASSWSTSEYDSVTTGSSFALLEGEVGRGMVEEALRMMRGEVEGGEVGENEEGRKKYERLEDDIVSPPRLPRGGEGEDDDDATADDGAEPEPKKRPRRKKARRPKIHSALPRVATLRGGRPPLVELERKAPPTEGEGRGEGLKLRALAYGRAIENLKEIRDGLEKEIREASAFASAAAASRDKGQPRQTKPPKNPLDSAKVASMKASVSSLCSERDALASALSSRLRSSARADAENRSLALEVAGLKREIDDVRRRGATVEGELKGARDAVNVFRRVKVKRRAEERVKRRKDPLEDKLRAAKVTEKEERWRSEEAKREVRRVARVVDRLRGEVDDLGWEAVEDIKERGEKVKMEKTRRVKLEVSKHPRFVSH